MSAPFQPGHPLDDAMRRVHWSVLGTLLVCGVIIGAMILTADPPPEASVGRSWSVAALVLAAGSILTRRVAAGPARQVLYRSLTSLLLAGGLGLLGVAVAAREDQTTVGLLYTLAGVILSLRPPARLGAGSVDPAER